MKRLRFLLSVLCGLALPLGCVGPTAYDESGSTVSKQCTTPAETARLIDHVLQLVNLERAEVGGAPVVVAERLRKIAEDYACRMIEEDYFGHTEPDSHFGPGERAAAAKYSFYAVGENLAAGQHTAAEVMQVWMDSPAHRRVILDPSWKEIGIAVRFGGRYGIYWVQEFGEPTDF